MEWVLAFVASLWTVAIAGVGLWLGWTTRDRVGESLREQSVSPIGSEPTLEPAVTLEDYIGLDLTDDERRDENENWQ
jgi:hypothetical protein